MSRTNRDINHNMCKRLRREGEYMTIDCLECRGCPTHTTFLRKEANTTARAKQNNAFKAQTDDPEIPIFKSGKE